MHQGQVYLSYGVFAPEDFDEEAYAKLSEDDRKAAYAADLKAVIDDDVVPRLNRHRLDVEWNGDRGTRILLRNAQWFAKLTQYPLEPGRAVS